MDDLRNKNKPIKNMGNILRQEEEEESMSCRECGKGFQSWKALYGHMRSHSKRENNNVAAAVALPRWSSRRMRFYKTAETPPSSSSSSVWEIDQEQIEAATTLMMLSRGVGLNSSDEGKRISGKRDRGFDFSSDENENPKSLKTKKLDYVISNSGFLKIRLKKVQSNVSVDGFLRNDELRKRNQEDTAGSVELEKNFFISKEGNRKRSKFYYSEAELGEDSIEEAETMDRVDSEFRKFDHNSSKRSRIGDASDSEKRNRFVCKTCNKSFNSHQALGGHISSSHKKIKTCFGSRIKSSENTYDVSGDQIEKEEKDGDINGVAEASCYESVKRCNLVGGSEQR